MVAVTQRRESQSLFQETGNNSTQRVWVKGRLGKVRIILTFPAQVNSNTINQMKKYKEGMRVREWG